MNRLLDGLVSQFLGPLAADGLWGTLNGRDTYRAYRTRARRAACSCHTVFVVLLHARFTETTYSSAAS